MSAVQRHEEPAMSDERTRRGPRQWGNGDIIAILAAMVVVMALITFTLHWNSPLVATGPSITPASEPTTTGQKEVMPMRGRRDIER
jgi:hypothetical protein